MRSFSQVQVQRTIDMKTCTVCHETKPMDAFYKHAGRSDGIDNRCKECKQAYEREPKTRYDKYKRDAKRRNYSWELTFDEFMSFWQEKCSYCDVPIETIGLDRIDNTQGYKISNVTPCCSSCNNMKADLEEDTFVLKVIKIYHAYAKDKM